ncbi:MAG: hypothetical protein ACLTER_01135 [Ruminococcus sp.]
MYESFEQMGWLFTRIMPEKPRIIKRDRIFRSVLKEKLANTYNDKNRILFRHMLAIIDFEEIEILTRLIDTELIALNMSGEK